MNRLFRSSFRSNIRPRRSRRRPFPSRQTNFSSDFALSKKQRSRSHESFMFSSSPSRRSNTPRRHPLHLQVSLADGISADQAKLLAVAVEYKVSRFGGQVIEKTVDPEKGTVTVKSSGCNNPSCNPATCTAHTHTLTRNANGEVECASKRLGFYAVI